MTTRDRDKGTDSDGEDSEVAARRPRASGPQFGEYSFVLHRLYDRVARDEKRVFLVVGPSPGAGTTFCCLRVAEAACEHLAGRSIALVDMNLPNPSLSQAVGSPEAGWVTWLRDEGASPLKGAARAWPGRPSFEVLPTGRVGDLREAMALLPRWPEVFAELRRHCDIVLVDVPAFYKRAEALMLSRSADEVMVVIEAESTKRAEALRMIRELKAVPVPILGLLFNKMRDPVPGWIRRRLL